MWYSSEFGGTNKNCSPIKLNTSHRTFFQYWIIANKFWEEVDLEAITWKELVFAEFIFAKCQLLKKEFGGICFCKCNVQKEILLNNFEWRITANFENSVYRIVRYFWQSFRFILDLKTQLQLIGVSQVV